MNSCDCGFQVGDKVKVQKGVIDPDFNFEIRVEEEQNLPDSPDDAASSTGSDVGTGNFATAATLRSLKP